MILHSQIIQISLKMGFLNMVALVLKEIRRRLNSNEIHYGFYFDLKHEIPVNPPTFPLKIRPILPEDIPRLFYSSTNHITHEEIRERIQRLFFLKTDVPTCFVASKSDQFPCALCWLITPRENPRIEHYFSGGLPPLKPYEMLLEFVFVHPDYRGKGLMEWISKKLFVQARSKGARRAIAFVRGENKSSLATTRSIGWKPFLRKNVRWKFFKRRITYETLNAGLPEKQA